MPSLRHTYCISNIVIQDYNKIKHLHSVNIENKSEDQNKTQLILKQQGAVFGWSKSKGKFISVTRIHLWFFHCILIDRKNAVANLTRVKRCTRRLLQTFVMLCFWCSDSKHDHRSNFLPKTANIALKRKNPLQLNRKPGFPIQISRTRTTNQTNRR